MNKKNHLKENRETDELKKEKTKTIIDSKSVHQMEKAERYSLKKNLFLNRMLFFRVMKIIN